MHQKVMTHRSYKRLEDKGLVRQCKVIMQNGLPLKGKNGSLKFKHNFSMKNPRKGCFGQSAGQRAYNQKIKKEKVGE